MANWIAGAIKHPGALRRSLHVKKGRKIGLSRLRRLSKGSGVTGKRARLAITLSKFRHKKAY